MSSDAETQGHIWWIEVWNTLRKERTFKIGFEESTAIRSNEFSINKYQILSSILDSQVITDFFK